MTTSSRRDFLGIAAAGSALAANGVFSGATSAATADRSQAGGRAGRYVPPVKFGLGGVPLGNEFEVVSDYEEFTDAQREAVVAAYPRTPHFKEDIIQAFYNGIKHKPETTFGNVKADVLADKDPHFVRGNFCSVIRGSSWKSWAGV